jgi:cysteinyl-tRNA synthetase
MVNGEKMSKSLGNFFTLRDLENQGRTGREIRYVLMGTHYRKKLNFTFDALDQARETLKKFDDCFVRLAAANGDGSGDSEAAAAAEKAVANFKAAMFDDLNTAEASAAIYSLFHDANKLLAAGTVSADGAAKMLDAFRTFDKVWACLDVDAALAADNSIPAEIEALAAARLTLAEAVRQVIVDGLNTLTIGVPEAM